MRAYSTEAEVVAIIEAKLLEAGSHANVYIYSDSQGNNTDERKAVFRSAIALKGSEPIINQVINLNTDTDRSIWYKGSQVEPTDQGEIRYLYFEATINPNEEY